jgi:hypothetical protein
LALRDQSGKRDRQALFTAKTGVSSSSSSAAPRLSETDATRGRTDGEMLSQHQAVLSYQDTRLDSISDSVARAKNTSLAISDGMFLLPYREGGTDVRGERGRDGIGNSVQQR